MVTPVNNTIRRCECACLWDVRVETRCNHDWRTILKPELRLISVRDVGLGHVQTVGVLHVSSIVNDWF